MARKKLLGKVLSKSRRRKKGKSEIKSKKNKRFSLIIVFILIILFSISITEFAYFFYKIKYVKVYDMKMQVGMKVGMAAGGDDINFGIVSPRGTCQKKVIIVNNEKIPLRVTALIKGELKKYVFVGENNFILEPGEMKELSVIASVPTNSDFGNYTGKLILILTRT